MKKHADYSETFRGQQITQKMLRLDYSKNRSNDRRIIEFTLFPIRALFL